MKTNEELRGMTQDELVAYAQNLQSKSEEYQKVNVVLYGRKEK